MEDEELAFWILILGLALAVVLRFIFI